MLRRGGNESGISAGIAGGAGTLGGFRAYCHRRPFGGSALRVVGQVARTRRPFSFTVEPYFDGGFVLSMDFADGGARIGRWPTPEKAQEMAQKITGEVLGGAILAWHAQDGAQH